MGQKNKGQSRNQINWKQDIMERNQMVIQEDQRTCHETNKKRVKAQMPVPDATEDLIWKFPALWWTHC